MLQMLLKLLRLTKEQTESAIALPHTTRAVILTIKADCEDCCVDMNALRQAWVDAGLKDVPLVVLQGFDVKVLHGQELLDVLAVKPDVA